LTIQLTFLFI